MSYDTAAERTNESTAGPVNTSGAHAAQREAADLGTVASDETGGMAAQHTQNNMNWQPLTGSTVDVTEATNATIALKVAECYRDRLCYVRSTDKAQAIDRAAGWLQYKEGMWTRDGAETATLKAIEQTIRTMLKEASKDPDTSKVQQRTRDLLNALNRMPAIKQVATYYLDRRLGEFNPDPNLLNVQNGTLDLLALDPKRKTEHSHLLCTARATDLCSKQVHARYVPDAQAPRWEQFLNEVFDDDAVIAYVQRALGYSLLGANPEHAAFICYGGGGNGKSTLLDTITDLLGGYAGILSPDVLVSDYVRTGSSLQPELTAHRDTRLIVSSEPKRGVLNSHRIKSWTGDSNIQLRMLYGEPETIPVTFTLWLMTNVLPDINELSVAVERRMHVVPFMASFVGREDLELKATLARERDGILAWLVAGLVAWYKQGLHPPESIIQAAKDWYESESLYTTLFDEVLTRGTGTDRVLLSDLTEALTHYVDDHDDDFPRVVVNTKLVNEFIKVFGLTKRTVGGQVYVYGVTLGTDEWHLDAKEDQYTDWTVKQKLYLALCEGRQAHPFGMGAATLAEATGLSQKSLYVILKRMVDEGLLWKREGALYCVELVDLDFNPSDKEDEQYLNFFAQLAWKLLEGEADEHGGEARIDPERFGRRIGLHPHSARELLHRMAQTGGSLVETVNNRFGGLPPTSEFTSLRSESA